MASLPSPGLPPQPPRRTIADRMAAATAPDPSGCHIWTRSRNNRGYGVVYFDGKVRLAHRVAWFLANDRWPAEGLVIDHVCDVKACVNPEHLRELQNHLNLRRAYASGDAETEAKRARWRRANAKRRGTYRYAEGL